MIEREKISEAVTQKFFAEVMEVSPARVALWIDDGTLSGPALVGEGRAAMIRPAIAWLQLRYGNIAAALAVKFNVPLPHVEKVVRDELNKRVFDELKREFH